MLSQGTGVATIFQFYFEGTIDGLNIERSETSKEHSHPIVNAAKIFG